MKEILAITYCFPPIFVPASICYLKLVKGLHELGYPVQVLSIDPRSFQSPQKIEETIIKLVPREITNHTVWSLENNFFIRFCRKYGLFNWLYDPPKMEWYYPAIRKARTIRNFDVILSCSQPHACHWVGYYLKKRTNKPWIAYFSDPWTDNPYVEYRSEKILGLHLRMEREVIENADQVLFTTDEMRNLIMRKYPHSLTEKTGVLSHCFVPDWYGGNSNKETEVTDKIQIIHTGNFYKIRTPMPLLSAVEQLREHRADLEEKMEILSFGEVEQEHIDYVRRNRLDDVVRFNATIPYIASLKMMKRADFLLLIDAPLTNNDESVFLPSKLIDYIGSLRPVLGVTPSKGASARTLSQTGNVWCDLEDTQALREILNAVVEHKLQVFPDRDRINQYHYCMVSTKMGRVIEALK